MTLTLSGHDSNSIFSAIFSNTAKNSDNISGIFIDTAIFSGVLSDTAIFSNTAENSDIVKKERKKVMLAYFLLYSCFNIRHF